LYKDIRMCFFDTVNNHSIVNTTLCLKKRSTFESVWIEIVRIDIDKADFCWKLSGS